MGSAWVSGQVIFSGYIANNPNRYPRSTFDLAVFMGKFHSSRKSLTAKRMVYL